MLINILIIFFIIIILYQLFLSESKYKFNNNNIIEGLTSQGYQPYDLTNPGNVLILAQQNAGNIQVLKEQLDTVVGLEKKVKDMSSTVETLNLQVSGLMQQQKQTAEAALPSSPPMISGST